MSLSISLSTMYQDRPCFALSPPFESPFRFGSYACFIELDDLRWFGRLLAPDELAPTKLVRIFSLYPIPQCLFNRVIPENRIVSFLMGCREPDSDFPVFLLLS